MNGTTFEKLVRSAFCPFLVELGFQAESIHVSGRHYKASLIGRGHVLVVSFEPGEDQFTVMMMTAGLEDVKSIDDRSKTPRLSDLNERYMAKVTPSERAENEVFFSGMESRDKQEHILLKIAKDLRLVLPLYLDDIHQ